MKCAVIYHSETGNTERIAREIFESLAAEEKELIDMNETSYVPQADIYIIGFPIRNQSCSIKVIDCMEYLAAGKVALFSTCGLLPTEKYKEKLEDSITVWLPDSVEYLGMFLCQGKTKEEQKEYFCQMNPSHSLKIRQMLDEGDHHPDDNDIEKAVIFTRSIEAVG